MKCPNLASDRMMVITLSFWIGDVVEVNIQREWIVKQIVTKFGCLKIDNGGDAVINMLWIV